ncbi:MAG: hypothetical protein AVO35_06000 [Candidatus Aegiribacteria sp. MLS_C]|nr:MAG: hypothetical protein AVO35_06000 [Candidatus Aegiribacteria sp. MLS_C]
MIHAAAAIIVILLTVGLTVMFLKRRYRKVREEVALLHPEHSRLMTAPMANFFGRRSLGMGQVRGNGILLLTREAVHFRMLLPRRELTIPLRDIVSISTPGSFLGRSRRMKLLQIDFHSADAGEDSAAWLVGDLDEWADRLRGMTGTEPAD